MDFWKRITGKTEGADEIAEAVVNTVTSDAFDHMQDRQFRGLLNLDNLSDEENVDVNIELELSGLVLAYLSLESLEAYSEQEVTKLSLRRLRNALLPAFIEYVKPKEIPEEVMREQLSQAVAQRCVTCREILDHHRSEPSPEDLKRNFWPPICAELTLNYLTEDAAVAEKLFDHLAVWNGRLSVEIEKAMLERAKLTISATEH